MENGMALDTNDDKQSISILGDKNKILGQMKSQFNSTAASSITTTSLASASGSSTSDENDLLIDEDPDPELEPEAEADVEVDAEKLDKSPVSGTTTDSSESSTSTTSGPSSRSSSDDTITKPPIIMSFKKTSSKMTTRSGGQAHKPETTRETIESEGLKRSTRRRSKDCNESVLQTAIARKEKSYNETAKPQRLTRQLKPTQKILDNIASAAANKDTKTKQKRKAANNDRDRNKRRSEEPSGLLVNARRSGRLAVSHSQCLSESDEYEMKLENGLNEDSKDSKVDFLSLGGLDADSATAQLIASRLCVCTSPTKFTPMSESSIYCNALDSINDRLIGCNNGVQPEVAWMLRPSTRVPYMVLCGLHRRRLQDHHCCAMCGVFCTQGGFVQCINKHLYHKHCKLSIGALECCPHCGVTEKHTNVVITMDSDAPLEYTGTQTSPLAQQGQPVPVPVAIGQAQTPMPMPVASNDLSFITVKKSHPPRLLQPKLTNTNVNIKKMKSPSPIKKEIKLEPVVADLDDLDDDSNSIEMELMQFDNKSKRNSFKKEAPLMVYDEFELDELNVDMDLNLDTTGGSTKKHDINELFQAIKNGLYAEIATLLSDSDLDLTQQIDFNEPEDDENEEKTKTLVQEKGAKDTESEFGNETPQSGTVLHYAAKHGLVPIMHMLKIADVDLNLLDNENNTPLMIAVACAQQEALKYLTTAGASVGTKGTDGMTALHLACKCGNLQATKELLLAAAHIKGYIDCPDDGGWTPLVWACEHNHVDIVKLLLSEGADPQLPDVEGNVALHWAAFGGSIAIVELILNFGGKMSSVNDQGDTPLHIAARHDNYNCVMVFVTRGAPFDVKNESDETALDCAPNGTKSQQTLVVNDKLQSLINVNKK